MCAVCDDRARRAYQIRVKLQTPNRKQIRRHALERQTRRLQARLAELRSVSDRTTWIRLAIFLIGFAVSVFFYFAVGAWLFALTSVVSLVVFGLTVAYHRRVRASIDRHTIWLHIKSMHIARIGLDWDNLPDALPGHPQPDHPFEIDLDLTGERSIHRLVDTAASQEGGQRLRDWLLEPIPDAARIRERQALVRELVPLAIFRDKLALSARLASQSLRGRWQASRLTGWLERDPEGAAAVPALRSSLVLLASLAAVNIVLFIPNAAGAIPPVWRLSLLIYAAFFLIQSRRMGDLFESAKSLEDTINSLRAVFEYLETYHYDDHQALKKLCQPFLDRSNRPSVHLRRIARIVAAVSVQRNAFLWMIFNAIGPWDTFFAYRLSRCKADLALLMPTWLDVWFELEALNSLASLSYLNPDYTFPEVGSPDKGSLFSARGLGHPLIPDDRKVCNDFVLDAPGEIVIVTGSNMAGKSSFLRTLGVNLCLANAGGPVNALALQTALFRVYTCIRVSDSVTDGFSYFYAEVRRLKALLVALEREHPFPLLFMIDEIFRGTNNRERLIGSRAYIRALVGRNGLGVIATHDLELVKLADDMPTIRNCHFKEEVIDGRMVFDYRLRPGPCPTTNALKIMQMEGLPVDPVEIAEHKAPDGLPTI